MTQIQTIFRYLRPVPEKLLGYGFEEADGGFTFRREILGGQFLLTVFVGKDGSVETELSDMLTGDPYTLHLIEDAAGSFVGQVRAEYGQVLGEIAEHCFVRQVFRLEMTHVLLAYALETYGEEPEYLWDKFPDNAVLRRKDNGKWYAAILTVERKKLGLAGEGSVEVADLRADPAEVPRLVDNVKIFGGWHMNKKHWISLPLDGSVPFREIAEFLEESRNIAAKR